MDKVDTKAHRLGSIVFNDAAYKVTGITVDPTGKQTIEMINLTTNEKEVMNYYSRDFDFSNEQFEIKDS